MRCSLLTCLAIFLLRCNAGAADFEVHVAPPVIPDREFRLSDFGGVGDGKTLNTEAFRNAIAAIEKAGGGRLIVSKGVYRTLPFQLCSALELRLEAGAEIAAVETFTAYGLPEPETIGSQAEVRAKVKAPPPLIGGKDLHDVAITGSGVIDGGGRIWWEWSERAAREAKAKKKDPNRIVYPRAHMVKIEGCQRLYIEGVTFRNSPMFHLVPTRVTDLLIERAKFAAPENAPNTDAIDPGRCERMIIRDCDFDVGDDDVAIKSGGRDLLVEDCRIRHGHGISIGSETTAGVSRMVVRRCTLDGADNGIRIKSMRGAGGVVEDVRYTDLTMTNVENVIVLDLHYVDNNRPDFKGDPTKVPTIRNVLIENVTATGCKNAGKIVGLPDSKISDVTLRNVRIEARKDLVIEDVGTITREKVTIEVSGKVTR